MRRLSDTIVENPKPHGKSYNKWLGDQAKPSHRELLRTAIDKALARKPADMPAFLKELEQSGCTVGQRGKNITLCAPGWKKPARMGSLGKGYTQEDVAAVLSAWPGLGACALFLAASGITSAANCGSFSGMVVVTAKPPSLGSVFICAKSASRSAFFQR